MMALYWTLLLVIVLGALYLVLSRILARGRDRPDSVSARPDPDTREPMDEGTPGPGSVSRKD